MFWFFISNTGSILRGGFFRFKTKYIEDFPIPDFNSNNRDMVMSIETLVSRILSIRNMTPCVKTFNEEIDIDKLVYKLYGLDYDEVLIVDPKSPITREEYEKGGNQ